MLMTVCKKTAIARALQRTLLSAAVLCLSAAPGPFDVLVAQAAESSLPQTMPDGGPNLTEAWMRNGGARLYWNTLTQPRQIRMAGAAFADPAAVPELMSSPRAKADGKSVGKGGRSAAPHSIMVDPNAPVRPWPSGASRPAKKDATAAGQQATAPAVKKPASTSPALTPPASLQGNGKAGPGASSATTAPASGKNASRGGAAATANGQSGSPTSGQPKASAGAGSALSGAGPAAAAPYGGKAAATPSATSPAASPAVPSVSLTGKGAGASALGQAADNVRQANANSASSVPPPPSVPALTADDLLPPSNGAGQGTSPAGASPVRAPLP